MSKFKAGDRVSFNENYGLALIGDVATVVDVDGDIVRVDVDSKGSHSCYDKRLSLVANSPIRTVTRREIVPGRYGILEVGAQLQPDRASFRVVSTNHSADQLREASHLLAQLAEVLEDNAAADVKAAA